MRNINQSKKDFVNKVFTDVSDKYDLMNDLMSFGVHRIWKSRLLDWMSPKKNDSLVDIASGTGDIAKAFLKRVNHQGSVACVEPSESMLTAGKEKLKKLSNIKWYRAPAEKLPFNNESFDIYVVSFGMRNFSNIDLAIKEAKRVLKTGGRLMCLEFSKVDNEVLSKIYDKYSKLIPYLGKYIIGKSEPYEYLIDSIKKFYSQEELLKKLEENGFEKVEYRNLSGGIVAIHSAWKI